MIIKVASKNSVKVSAVEEMVKDYPHLMGAKIVCEDIDSGVSKQPKSLEETIKGAMNRAKGVYKNCDFSFGIESGLMVVPYTKSGYMDVCVCVIFDGREYHLGLSSAWEVPQKVTEYMFDEDFDMNQAALKTGLTQNPKIGSSEGLIGVMTKGRLVRKEYTKEAIRTALINIDK